MGQEKLFLLTQEDIQKYRYVFPCSGNVVGTGYQEVCVIFKLWTFPVIALESVYFENAHRHTSSFQWVSLIRNRGE